MESGKIKDFMAMRSLPSLVSVASLIKDYELNLVRLYKAAFELDDAGE